MAKYVIDTDNCPFKIKTLLAMGWKEEDGLERFKTIGIDEVELLDADYINDNYGDLQDIAYKAGLEDAWECARKIAKYWTEIDNDDLLSMFGIDERIGHSTIMALLGKQTASEAIAKLAAYEQKQEEDAEQIRVGDEVDAAFGNAVVTRLKKYDGQDAVDYLYCSGDFGWDFICDVSKTGKHYDIAELLEKMKGE